MMLDILTRIKHNVYCVNNLFQEDVRQRGNDRRNKDETRACVLGNLGGVTTDIGDEGRQIVLQSGVETIMVSTKLGPMEAQLQQMQARMRRGRQQKELAMT